MQLFSSSSAPKVRFFGSALLLDFESWEAAPKFADSSGLMELEVKKFISRKTPKGKKQLLKMKIFICKPSSFCSRWQDFKNVFYLILVHFCVEGNWMRNTHCKIQFQFFVIFDFADFKCSLWCDNISFNPLSLFKLLGFLRFLNSWIFGNPFIF